MLSHHMKHKQYSTDNYHYGSCVLGRIFKMTWSLYSHTFLYQISNLTVFEWDILWKLLFCVYEALCIIVSSDNILIHRFAFWANSRLALLLLHILTIKMFDAFVNGVIISSEYICPPLIPVSAHSILKVICALWVCGYDIR